MMFGRNPREQVIEPVLRFMQRNGLELEHLTNIGGQDLKSSARTQREMAGRVSRCWELIARQGIDFAELVTAVGSMPAQAPRRRRHRAAVEQAIDNVGELGISPIVPNPNEINDLAVSGSVGELERELPPTINRAGPRTPTRAPAAG
jgi:hypothetical protein